MARRAWAVLALSLFVAPALGCSLSRSALGGRDGGGVDTGMGGHDAGPDSGNSCGASCDDGNSCTNDACNAAGSCTHMPATGSCDDHLFCNGTDSCGTDGTCSVHSGNPCTGTTHCDASQNMCLGCVTAADCPAPIMGDFGPCDFGGSLCAISGTQTRSSMTFTCEAGGVCNAVTSTTSQVCTRATTDGSMCAAPTTSDWTSCAFGTDPCTVTGTKTRTSTTSHCGGGNCVATDTSETMSCTRPSTDGAACGTTMTTRWSACMVGAACSASGTRTRTTTGGSCTGGSCAMTSTPETMNCMPDSTAPSCGPSLCSAWGTCQQVNPNMCDRTGVQTRTCSTATCTTGTGGPSTCTDHAMTTEMQGCNAAVDGTHCTTFNCSFCSTGLFQCTHGATGSQRCTTTEGTCATLGGTFCNTGFSGGTSMNRSCTCP